MCARMHLSVFPRKSLQFFSLYYSLIKSKFKFSLAADSLILIHNKPGTSRSKFSITFKKRSLLLFKRKGSLCSYIAKFSDLV